MSVDLNLSCSFTQWLTLRTDSEKNGLTEEAHRILKNIRQMEASLDDNKAREAFQQDDDELKITYPLMRCLQVLKEKHNTIAKIHRERFEEVKSTSTYGRFEGLALTYSRARRGLEIICISSGAFFRPGYFTANLVSRICPNHLRPLPFLHFEARQ